MGPDETVEARGADRKAGRHGAGPARSRDAAVAAAAAAGSRGRVGRKEEAYPRWAREDLKMQAMRLRMRPPCGAGGAGRWARGSVGSSAGGRAGMPDGREGIQRSEQAPGGFEMPGRRPCERGGGLGWEGC